MIILQVLAALAIWSTIKIITGTILKVVKKSVKEIEEEERELVKKQLMDELKRAQK